jgi:glycosyltransferase involved in cell wall biosynthesis
MLIAPMPERDAGGIFNWARIIHRKAAGRSDLELLFVNTAVRYRRTTNMAVLSRLFGGSLQAIRDMVHIYRRLKSDGPDLLHLCTSASLSTAKDWAIFRLARHFKVPAVVHYRFGRLPRVVAQGGWEWRLIRKTITLSRAVITLDAKSQACIRGAMPQANVLRLPNMVEIDAVDAIARKLPPQPGTDGRIGLVYVGQLFPTKGLRELIAACARLSGCRLTLDVVGPGSPDFVSALRKLASCRGPADWLRFHGEVDHDEAIRCMVRGDVLVLPSYSEGMPNVVLEAMACGKAVLATSVGAVPELLDIDGPQPSGICVAPRDAEALGAAVLQLAGNPGLRRELGQRGRRRAERLYAAPVAFAQLLSLWESLGRRVRVDAEENCP